MPLLDKKYMSKNSRNHCEDAPNPFSEALQAQPPDHDEDDPAEWEKYFRKRRALEEYFMDVGIKKRGAL